MDTATKKHFREQDGSISFLFFADAWKAFQAACKSVSRYDCDAQIRAIEHEDNIDFALAAYEGEHEFERYCDGIAFGTYDYLISLQLLSNVAARLMVTSIGDFCNDAVHAQHYSYAAALEVLGEG